MKRYPYTEREKKANERYRRAEAVAAYAVALGVILGCFFGVVAIAQASTATIRWNDAVVTQVTAVPSGLDIEATAGGATQTFRCLKTSLYFHYCQAVQVGDRLYLVGHPAPDDVDEPFVRLTEIWVDLETTVTPPAPGGGGDRDGD